MKAAKDELQVPMSASTTLKENGALQWLYKEGEPFFVDQCHISLPLRAGALDAEAERCRVSEVIISLLIKSVGHVVTGSKEILLDGNAIVQQAGSDIAPGTVLRLDHITEAQIVLKIDKDLTAMAEDSRQLQSGTILASKAP